MANVITRLVARLKGTSAVTTLLGTRIYPNVAPREDMPLAILTKISTTPGNTAGGTDSTESCRIQIDIYGETYDATRAAADAVRACLAPTTAWTDSTGSPVVSSCRLLDDTENVDGTEPGSDISVFRVTQDYSVWYH